MTSKRGLQKIANGDAVMLYNQTQKKYLSKPFNARYHTKAIGLVSFPELTSDPTQIGLFVISATDSSQHFIHSNHDVLIRTISVGEEAKGKIYMGVSTNDALVASGFTMGQTVSYRSLDDNSKLLIWKFVTPERAFISEVSSFATSSSSSGIAVAENRYYGVPYVIKNKFYQTTLQVSGSNPDLVVANIDVQDAHPDVWIILPTSPIYTCQRSVNLCATTRGEENAYSPFVCKDRVSGSEGKEGVNKVNEGACRNLYNEPVFFDQNTCSRECGIVVSAVQKKVTTTPTTPPQKIKSKSESVNLTLPIVIVIIIGIVVFVATSK